MRDLPVKRGELYMLLRDVRELEPLEAVGIGPGAKPFVVYSALENDQGYRQAVALATNQVQPRAGFVDVNNNPSASRLMELFAVAPQALEALLDRLSRAAVAALTAGVNEAEGAAERELWEILEPFLD